MRVLGAIPRPPFRVGRRPIVFAIALVAPLLVASDRAPALTAARVSTNSAVPLLAMQPSDSMSPAAPALVIYPPPRVVPAGVSICGPLFTAAQRPTCAATGTLIQGEHGDLSSFGLAIALPGKHRFPNLTRDITLSQRVAGNLYTVLGHAKFDGQLIGTQIISLSQLQAHLRLQLIGGNVYRVEVDQKTGALDFRDDLVGIASFTYTR